MKELIIFIADRLGYKKPEKKPEFKDAEEGMNVKYLRNAVKILEEFKKILEVEVL